MHPQRRGGGGGPPDGGKAAQEGRKVFIGNLSWDTKDADFTKYFEQFGPIEEAIVMRQKDGGSRGFGFVSYKDRETVDKVIAQQKLELDGRRVSLFKTIQWVVNSADF
jgi:RNA recognition motif-containing protein